MVPSATLSVINPLLSEVFFNLLDKKKTLFEFETLISQGLEKTQTFSPETKEFLNKGLFYATTLKAWDLAIKILCADHSSYLTTGNLVCTLFWAMQAEQLPVVMRILYFHTHKLRSTDMFKAAIYIHTRVPLKYEKLLLRNAFV